MTAPVRANSTGPSGVPGDGCEHHQLRKALAFCSEAVGGGASRSTAEGPSVVAAPWRATCRLSQAPATFTLAAIKRELRSTAALMPWPQCC